MHCMSAATHLICGWTACNECIMNVHMHLQAVPWCYGGDAWMMGGDFLIVWGARWGPLMRLQPYRWFTSWFLHESFTHVLSNMLLFLVIAIQVSLPSTLILCTAMMYDAGTYVITRLLCTSLL